MQKAKGNHHKMSEKQSDEHIIPIVVGEYDSEMGKTPEGSPSIAGVENNSKKLSVVFEKMGQVAAKAVHVIREAYAAERIDVDAKRPENDEGVMERLGFPGNTENSTGASEGSTDTSKPGANKPDAKKSKADASQGKNAGEGTKSTSEKQDSNAKPDAKKSKADASQGKNAGEGTKSTSEKQDSNAKPDAKKSKADASQGKQAPDAAKDFMSGFLDRIKQDQGSSAAESSKDKQTKDLNSEDATYVDDTPTEKIDLKTYEAATNLKLARMRFSKASIAVESHFFKKFFGGKKRQEELNAATEELKKSELEYMRLKFADKIEAAKQDPEKQAELAAEMGQAALANMRETSRTTTDKYDDMLDDRNIFKKAAAKVGKVFNNGGKIAQTLKLGGAGFAVGTATGLLAGTAGWPITAAVGVVTKLGVAGATKQAILEEYRGEDRTGYASLGTIDPSFEKAVANMKIDDVMEHAVNVSVDNLKDVSVERQDALQKKVLWSLGKYATGFILGGVVGSFIGDYLWDNNSAHAAGAESQKTSATPQQSGSGQIPQQPSGASSMNNSIAKEIVNAFNPDTLNFDSYDYPWDWAAKKFGAANAMDQLHNLADKAMANGHAVRWYNTGGIEYLEVDGSSVTADVLKVLNKYA